MALTEWMQKRKVKEFSRQYANLLVSRDIQSALILYKENLLPLSYLVNKSIRASYHLYNWLTFNSEKDFQAIQLLAVNEKNANSSIIGALKLLRKLNRQRYLARSLLRQDYNALEVLKDKNEPIVNEPLTQLGFCILEILALKHNNPAGTDYSQAAVSIVRFLPPGDKLDAPFLPIREKLYAWAMYYNRDFSQLVQNIDGLTSIPIEKRTAYKIETICKWSESQLKAGNIEEAMQILKGLEALNEPQLIFKISLLFGYKELNSDMADRAVRWYSSLGKTPYIRDNQAHFNTFLLFLAVSYFKNNKLGQGRKIMQHLIQYLEGSSAEAPIYLVNGVSKDDLLSLVYYLSSLSFLAEMGSWSGSAEQYPAKWKIIRNSVLQYIQKLIAQSSIQSRKGNFLVGLLAYVESGWVLNTKQLNNFSSAIENINEQKTRARLKAIEAALLTRIKAAEEAYQLIIDRKYEDLRKFQQDVLKPLGDAIPSSLRAAVYIIFWENETSYNPIPDLQQIPRTPDNEALLNNCIMYVQAVQTIRHLKDLCLEPGTSTSFLPQLTHLKFHPQAAKIGNLAAAVVLSYQKKWEEILNNTYLSGQDDAPWFTESASYVTFYAAWRTGKISICRQIFSDNPKHSLLKKSLELKRALNLRLLIDILETDPVNSRNFINGFIRKKGWIIQMISFITWCIAHKKNQAAATFLELVIKEIKNTSPGEYSQIYWLCSFLESMVLANLGKYNACLEKFEQIISENLPPNSFFIDPQTVQQLKTWTQLFILQAKLILTVNNTADIKTMWPSLRRELESRAKQFQENPILQPYGYLIVGLISYLSTDILIDESIIANMVLAQEILLLNRNAQFIEKILGQLNWRKKNIDDFWNNLSLGKFHESNSIYQNELKPFFGNTIPSTIQLAIILVDWDLNAEKTTALLNRLSLLELHAPELDNNFITRVKNYILEGEKLRHLKKLLEEHEFNTLSDFIRNAEWEGYEKDTMPVPIAIALLYALYKTKKEEEVQYLGKIIGGNEHLPDWVKDLGMLLMGYTFFEKKDFQKAADCFEKISRSQILKHDCDKYWAAAHFSNGLQLLDINQKKKAFDAFARAMNKRSAAVENIKMIPLFFHLALTLIESGNCRRALLVFQLLKKNLEGLILDSANETFIHLFIAGLGELLCKSLIENHTIPGEKDFHALKEKLKRPPASVGPDLIKKLERTCLIMIICHILKRGLSPWSTLKTIEKNLLDIAAAIDDICGEKDPVVFVLRAVIELKFKNNVTEAIKWYENAKQLGCKSNRLDALFSKILKTLEIDAERKNIVINLFDTYLMNGEIPLKYKDTLVRKDDIAELYRLQRAYTPNQIICDNNNKTGVQLMCERLEHLIEQTKNIEFQENSAIADLCSQLQMRINSIKESERILLKTESMIMESLYHEIRENNTNL